MSPPPPASADADADAAADADADGSSHPGYRATVGALAVGQVLVWAVLYYGFSSLVLPMRQDTGWSEATLMGAFTVGLALWGLASYGVGAAIDAGGGRWVMVGGTVLGGLGCLAWAAVRQPWQLVPVWALLGVAMAATLYDPAFAVLTKRYPTRYREGITTLTLLGGFASTLSFPAIAALLHAGLDWRQTLQVLAAVLLLGVAPLHAWALRGPMRVDGARHHDDADDATLRQALRQRAFWLLTLCFLLYAFVQAAWWAHVMPAFDAKGVPQADALWVLMAVGPAQVLGRLVYALVGRGWSLRRLGALVLAALPVAMALFAWGRGLAQLLLFALVFGLANGLVTIVRGALVPMYWGRAHVGRIGGLMSAINLVARAAAPAATTALLLLLPGYREVVLLFAALGVVSVLAYWRAGPPT